MILRFLSDLILAARHPHAPARLARSAFQPAQLHHLDFIFDAHIREAATGHFSSDYLHPHTHAGLRAQLSDSITNWKCASRIGLVASRIYVCEDHATAIGFCWVRETAGPQGLRQEIYAVYIRPENRGQGLARALLEHVLRTFPKSTEFSARLFPVSVAMKSIFMGLGFEHEQQPSSQTIHLQRSPAGHGRTRGATSAPESASN